MWKDTGRCERGSTTNIRDWYLARRSKRQIIADTINNSRGRAVRLLLKAEIT